MDRHTVKEVTSLTMVYLTCSWYWNYCTKVVCTKGEWINYSDALQDQFKTKVVEIL